MISRLIRRRIAQVMLGAMLSAQAALAVAACDWLRVAPAQALAVKSGESSCHDDPAPNPNLCLAHCVSSDQSADTPQVVVPAWVDSPPLMVAAVDHWTGRAGNLRFELPRSSAPPPRILFQVFLI